MGYFFLPLAQIAYAAADTSLPPTAASKSLDPVDPLEKHGLSKFRPKLHHLANSILLCPPGGHFGLSRSVRLSVPWRSCLGYRHADCLQLSHRRPPWMCGLRTCPQTDVDPSRFLDRTAIGGGGISSRRPRVDTLFTLREMRDAKLRSVGVKVGVASVAGVSLLFR